MADTKTSIIISAIDQTRAGLDSVRNNLSGVQAAAAAVGISISAMGMVAVVKQSLDAADAMGKMAQKAGISVESFSRLSAAAKLSDVDTEQLAKGMGRLAQSITTAAAGTGTQKQAFDALGISVKDAQGNLKGTDIIIREVSDKFAGLEDGTGKTAAAMAIFGKAGQDMIPMLNQGSGELDRMAELSDKLGLTLSGKTSQAAQDVNDRFTTMQMATQGISNKIMTAMLPTLDSLSSVMVDAATDTGTMNAAAAAMANTLKGVVSIGMGVVYTFESIGIGIGGLAAAAAAAANGNFAGAKAALDAMWEDEAKTADTLTARINKLWGDTTTTTEQSSNKIVETRKKLNFVLGGGTGAATISEYDKLIAKLKGDMVTATAAAEAALHGYNKEQVKALELFASPVWAKMTETQRTEAAVLLEQAAAQGIARDEIEKAVKAAEAATKSEQEYMSGIGKTTEELITKAEAAELENAAIFMTADQLAGVIAARYNEQIAIKEAYAETLRGNEGREAELHLVEQQIIALGKLKNAEITRPKLQAQSDAWKNFSRDIESSLTDAVQRGLEKGGRDGAQVALDVIKNTLRTIPIKIIAQAVVDPVMGGVRSVMQGGSFSSGMMGDAGQAYNMYNTGANLLGVGSLGNAGGIANAIGFATGGYTSAVGGMAGMAGSTPIMAGAAEGAAASGLMSGMATAMPYLAAALVAYQLFSGKDGPTPQHLGTTSASFSPTGEMLSATGGGASGMFRNAGSDAFVQGMQSQYAASIAALGGKAAASAFFYGSGQQSDGTSAMRRIAGGASGGAFFNSGEIGASDAEVSLAASRAVFTALQGSELPGYLSKLFDGLTASSLSQEQISNTLAYAQSLKTLRDGLAETRTPMEIAQSQMASLATEFHTSATTFKTDFVAAIDAGITPATLTGWQQLGQAIDQVSAAQEQATKAAHDLAAAVLSSAQSVYDSAKSELLDTYARESDAAQQLADKMRGFATSFTALRSSLNLGSLSTLSPEAKYLEAQRQFTDVSRRAQLGDTSAMEQMDGVSQAFLQASRDYNASGVAYAADFDQVSRALEAAGGVAGRQADISYQQVSILQSQLSALGLINTSVLSLGDALAAFAGAQVSRDSAAKSAAGEYTNYAATDITAHFAAKAGITPQEAYNDIVAYNADPYAVGAAYGLDRTQTDAWFRDNDVKRIKGFAAGGDHAGGLRIVGERGWELESTGPSRIFNHDQAQKILSGGDNTETNKLLKEVVVELRALVNQGGAVGSATLTKLNVVADKLDGNKRELARAA